MKIGKKTLIIGIVVMLVLVSMSAMVTVARRSSRARGSPLYNVRTTRTIGRNPTTVRTVGGSSVVSTSFTTGRSSVKSLRLQRIQVTSGSVYQATTGSDCKTPTDEGATCGPVCHLTKGIWCKGFKRGTSGITKGFFCNALTISPDCTL